MESNTTTIREFKDPITEEDVTIFGIDLKDDARGAGYNIGDLLNIPSLGGFWAATPHNSMEDLERLYYIGEAYKKSVLAHYIAHRPSTEIIPFLPRVVGAVKCYINEAPDNVHEWIGRVAQDDVLCIHIRCGDKTVEDEFMRTALAIAKQFRQVYIFSGLHLDQYFASNQKKIHNFLQSMNSFLCMPNIHFVDAEPDVHLSLMMHAKHLLVHKGGFSALGMIVANHNIYVTHMMDLMNEKWHELVPKKYTHLYCE